MATDLTRYYQDTNVAARYDRERFASPAGKVFNALEKHHIRRAFRGLEAGATVVDVPCGTGRLAEVLLEGGFRVVGMDISDAMLGVARQRLAPFGDRFESRVSDLLDSGFTPTEQYDAALCARVLMHFALPTQIAFLRNVARLSRGRIVFTHSWASPYQASRRKLKRALGHQEPVRHPVSSPDLDQLLEGAGLREVRRIRPCAPLTEEVIVVAEHRRG